MALRPDQLATWAALATVLERLPAALDAQLQHDSGLSHFEYGVLFALDSAPDRRMRLSEIAAYASCTLSRLSRAVTRLERDGLVERTVDPADGRFTLAVLTAAGHERVQQATPGHQDLVGQLVFDALTERQAQQLGGLMRRIAEAAGPEGVWSPETRPA